MAERQDALIAASHLAIAVRRDRAARAGPAGRDGRTAQREPNAPNVIPGVVQLTIELRDLSTGQDRELAARFRERAPQIAAETKTTIEMRAPCRNAPALATPDVQRRSSGGGEARPDAAACRAAPATTRR